MKILVLAQAYPSIQDPYAMSYVHSRCLAYVEHGHSVSVLNFSSTGNYSYEGIDVYADEIDVEKYDVIISHAPNLKNHVPFVSRLRRKKIAFFIHGHEVLRSQVDYPQPYWWKRLGVREKLFWNLYDSFKILWLRHWLRWVASRNRVGIVFVSEWMLRQFEENLKMKVDELCKYKVIPNSANDVFHKCDYKASDLWADFVTIRPLDESKYAIDLVVRFAEANPELKFDVYGKGEFFKYVKPPKNIKWYDYYLPQKDIPSLMNHYRAALMPTRYDAQGVMVCEMASYGIPVITTDIPICLEMLDGFENVIFMGESEYEKKFDLTLLQSACNEVNKKRFSADDLVPRELQFFDEL